MRQRLVPLITVIGLFSLSISGCSKAGGDADASGHARANQPSPRPGERGVPRLPETPRNAAANAPPTASLRTAASEKADGDRPPAPPLKEPVREWSRPPVRPPVVLTGAQKEIPKARQREILLEVARGHFGRLDNWLKPWYVVYWLEASAAQEEPVPSEICLDLGLAYLLVGRFDSTIEVLEKGRPEITDSQYEPHFERTLSSAKRVKEALTEARDSLRRQGLDVRYPDPRIFTMALSKTAAEDQFLMLNLADAYAAAYPTSVAALGKLADVNLGFYEHPPKVIVSPLARNNAAIPRGTDALVLLQQHDPENAYPAVRMAHHVLLTLEPYGERQPIRRRDLPDLVMDALREGSQVRLSDSQRAFLLYGRAMYLLKGKSWGRPIAAELIAWLETAQKLDPDVKAYSEVLTHLRKNKDAINQAKLRQRERDDEQAMARVRRMLGQPLSWRERAERGERALGALRRSLWELTLDDLRRQDIEGELAADILHEHVGCPACWGSGNGAAWGWGNPCTVCGGDGKADEAEYRRLEKTATDFEVADVASTDRAEAQSARGGSLLKNEMTRYALFLVMTFPDTSWDEAVHILETWIETYGEEPVIATIKQIHDEPKTPYWRYEDEDVTIPYPPGEMLLDWKQKGYPHKHAWHSLRALVKDLKPVNR